MPRSLEWAYPVLRIFRVVPKYAADAKRAVGHHPPEGAPDPETLDR